MLRVLLLLTKSLEVLAYNFVESNALLNEGLIFFEEMSLNSVTLVGRAGRDPEVRYFESGKVVANLTIAVNRRGRNDEPDWFNLEIWGKQAQVAADFIKKGSLIGITGSFKLDRWKDKKTGEDKTKPVIRVDRLDLLGSKRDTEMNSSSGDLGNMRSPTDEEIPF